MKQLLCFFVCFLLIVPSALADTTAKRLTEENGAYQWLYDTSLSMAAVFDDEVPRDVPERRAFLIRHQIAAWDVIHSCTIRGSSDASIRDVVANDLTVILDHAPIRQIYVNGKTAEKMYKKYIEPGIGRKAVCLPSTSPANAAWSLERLTEAWKVVREGAGH